MDKDPEVFSLVQQLIEKVGVPKKKPKTKPKNKWADLEVRFDPFEVRAKQGKEGLERRLQELEGPEVQNIIRRFALDTSPNKNMHRVTKKQKLVDFVLDSVGETTASPDSADGKIDVFEVYAKERADGLETRLKKLDETALRKIIKSNGLNNLKKSQKMKTQTELVDFILERVRAIFSRGDVFTR
jgi:hypothetical protein